MPWLKLSAWLKHHYRYLTHNNPYGAVKNFVQNGWPSKWRIRMKPEIVDRERLVLAGVTYCAGDVSDIDIHELWNVYGQSEPSIKNRIDGYWYELHIGKEQGNGIYSVTAGTEISELMDLPIEISIKIIPAGRYAHFAHCMKEGGFGEAFAKVDNWVKKSGTGTKDFGLQLYDNEFNPKDKNSILHIYIPLV